MTTLLQRYGFGRFRELPELPLTAAGHTDRYVITGEDAELGVVCCGCEHVFEKHELYAHRLIGAAGEFEIVEMICMECAQADTPVSYGQNRNLPTPDGWVHATIPVVVVEGMATGDGRIIPAGALVGHRALPLPLMSLSQTGPGAHEGATVLGRIDHLDRRPGPEVVNIDTGEPFPEGTFVWYSDDVWVNPEHPDYGWIRNGALNGISVDLVDTEAELLFDDDGPEDGMWSLTKGRHGAATTCTTPAFPGAYLVLDADLPEVDMPAEEPPAIAASGWRMESEALCASCSAPPADWFTDPGLAELTPLTITDDGQVYGHVAGWNICHIGLPGCTTAPRSRSDYAYFLTGSIVVDDGTQVPVGRITAGTGHADLGLGYGAAAEHYDHTGSAVADVACGEDQFGIWVAGAVRPAATDEQLRVLQASPPSGDWRPIGGHLEMVGVLCVNVPGFPVPRPRALAAAGVVTALVAAGAVPKQTDAPPPPQDAPPEDCPGCSVSEGDLVTIGDSGIQGVVTAAPGDDGVATVECLVEARMLNPVDAPAETPPAMSAALTRVARSLRLIEAGDLISRVSR